MFDWAGFKHEPRWTHHSGKQQIDYLLVSDPVFAAIQGVGIERRGLLMNSGPHFSQITGPQNEASDHACVWTDLAL